jgi:hypothetical protein
MRSMLPPSTIRMRLCLPIELPKCQVFCFSCGGSVMDTYMCDIWSRIKDTVGDAKTVI